jgi:hypothetical protein
MKVSKLIVLLLCLAVVISLSACSVHQKREEGGDKKVEIKVPFAEINVGTNTDAKDTGLSPYPGARPKESSGDDKHRANVQIGGEDFGVKVVAVTFVSDDAPEKVVDFYRKDLKRYGNVLECKKGISEDKHKDGGETRCSDSGHEEPGKLELAVGVPEKQRIVSVKPNGSGTEFSLVYVNVKGGRETL